MKNCCVMILTLAMLLNLAACGAGAPEPVDLTALYESFQETLPGMLVLDAATRMMFFGVNEEDCLQIVTAICADGMRTDEIWLIEAKDAAALERLAEQARNRLNAKAEETVSYSPDQYAIVQKAELLVKGNYLALLVSPDVTDLKAAFENAVK